MWGDSGSNIGGLGICANNIFILCFTEKKDIFFFLYVPVIHQIPTFIFSFLFKIQLELGT